FIFAWLIFCWFYYYFYCWLKTGQTLAMKAWRLKLVTNSGQDIQLWQAIVRFFGGLFGLSIITTILPQSWALHDQLSQTRIIVVPKEKKS
ncbi:MAG: RDD family protein, partial [Enterobacterales bacterium]|nr:RDD family protein [Enterobacterales bacterium]